jgi:hypothetical protein
VATVVRGVGNGGGDHTEGAWNGRVFGTYLHGPALARNTALADLLLSWAVSTTGDTPQLDPLDDHDEVALRSERLGAVEDSTANRFFRRLNGTRT